LPGSLIAFIRVQVSTQLAGEWRAVRLLRLETGYVEQVVDAHGRSVFLIPVETRQLELQFAKLLFGAWRVIALRQRNVVDGKPSRQEHAAGRSSREESTVLQQSAAIRDSHRRVLHPEC